jgi:phosphoglycolate phosphatase
VNRYVKTPVMARAILFDLDGTLVDTRAASWELFAETNLAFALGIDSREAFFRAFEGNFFESLARLCPDPQRAAAAKSHFMELLRTRYNPSLIPGMVDVVRALAPHSTLAVVSTNSIEPIRRILVTAGIATCFSHVFSGDVEPRKSVSIRRFLGDQSYAAQRQCAPAYREQGGNEMLQANDVVLVTDTVGDVMEAREAGVRAIGVAWGMHTERQLLDAGAHSVALWPQELVAWLRDDSSGCGDGTACASASTSGSACCAVPQSRPALAAPPATTAALASTHALADAVRIRREQQLKIRQASSSTVGTTQVPREADSAHDELLRALRCIVGETA